MTAYPNDFLGIQIHVWDDYMIDWSMERAEFYGVNGTPITWFDGVVVAEGVDTNDQKVYAWYERLMNDCLEVPTDTLVSLAAETLSSDSWRVTATVSVEAAGLGKPMVGHMVQVLDHYPASEDGQFRNAVMQHAQTDTFTVEAGATTTFAFDFEVSGESKDALEDVAFVAWVSDPSSSAPAQVFNAASLPYPFNDDVVGDGDDGGCAHSPSRGGHVGWLGLLPGLALLWRGRRSRG